jgi:hypothetical protein
LLRALPVKSPRGIWRSRIKHDWEENDMHPLLAILLLMRQGKWDEAHDLVQRDDSGAAAWLHALLHVQEGDLEDAEYWYEKSGRNFRSRGTLSEELDELEAYLRGLVT